MVPRIGTTACAFRRPSSLGSSPARSRDAGPASRPIAENAGADRAATADRPHQARAGAPVSARSIARMVQVHESIVPRSAQVKLLAEYHHDASRWTAERLKAAVAARPAVADRASRRTSTNTAGKQSRN